MGKAAVSQGDDILGGRLHVACVGNVLVGNRPCLACQDSGNGDGIPVKGHELHHKSFTAWVYVNYRADVPTLKFLIAVASYLGCQNNLFVLSEHFITPLSGAL